MSDEVEYLADDDGVVLEHADLEARAKRLARLHAKKAELVPLEGEVAPPLHWPSMSPVDAEKQWPLLAAWVEGLRGRYEELDTHYVPMCWFRHPSIVGALQALKDHERVSYGQSSPGAAGTDWHRAYRDITALLRQFVAKIKCSGVEHVDSSEPPVSDHDAFTAFAAEDVTERRRAASRSAAASF